MFAFATVLTLQDVCGVVPECWWNCEVVLAGESSILPASGRKQLSQIVQFQA